MLFDEEDRTIVESTGWTLTHNGYAYGKIAGKTVRFHRVVIGAKPGEIVDHINRNRLDNRKINLRIVTPAANSQNSIKAFKGNKTGFRNVWWYPKRKGFRSQVMRFGKKYDLGFYRDPLLAACISSAFRETFGVNPMEKPG